MVGAAHTELIAPATGDPGACHLPLPSPKLWITDVPFGPGVVSLTTIPFPSGCPGRVAFTTTGLPVTLLVVVYDITGLSTAAVANLGVASFGVPPGLAGEGNPGVGLSLTQARVSEAFLGDTLST